MKNVTEVCTLELVMHTWVYIHNEHQSFVEITWFEYEVSVSEGKFGTEVHKEDRRRFASPEEIREFIEDWFEQLKLDGYEELPAGEDLPQKQKAASPFPAAFAKALGVEAPAGTEAAVADDDSVDDYDDDDDDYNDEDDDHEGGDALDALDADDDPYQFDEFTESDEPDYERRSIPTLSVDEAFQEKIKENPYDLSIDPRREDADNDGLQIIDGDPYL